MGMISNNSFNGLFIVIANHEKINLITKITVQTTNNQKGGKNVSTDFRYHIDSCTNGAGMVCRQKINNVKG